MNAGFVLFSIEKVEMSIAVCYNISIDNIYLLERGNAMYLTVNQQLNHLSKADFETLRELSHIAKSLMNQAIYNVRQYYFAEKKYLRYEKNYALLKSSENYRLLNSNMAHHSSV